jgi:hypothetical protein
MFENLNHEYKALVFQGLRHLIESGEGCGFHNNDRRHPIYTEGAAGTTSEMSSKQDNAEKNALFRMLSALSQDFKENTDFTTMKWWYDFSEWQDFCKFAIGQKT